MKNNKYLEELFDNAMSFTKKDYLNELQHKAYLKSREEDEAVLEELFEFSSRIVCFYNPGKHQHVFDNGVMIKANEAFCVEHYDSNAEEHVQVICLMDEVKELSLHQLQILVPRAKSILEKFKKDMEDVVRKRDKEIEELEKLLGIYEDELF